MLIQCAYAVVQCSAGDVRRTSASAYGRRPPRLAAPERRVDATRVSATYRSALSSRVDRWQSTAADHIVQPVDSDEPGRTDPFTADATVETEAAGLQADGMDEFGHRQRVRRRRLAESGFASANVDRRSRPDGVDYRLGPSVVVAAAARARPTAGDNSRRSPGRELVERGNRRRHARAVAEVARRPASIAHAVIDFASIGDAVILHAVIGRADVRSRRQDFGESQ